MRYAPMPPLSPSLPWPACEQLPVERIVPRASLRAPQQGASLAALAESIRCYGLVRPIVVRRMTPGRYGVISGNRRLAACRMLGMPCIGVHILREDAALQPAERLLEALMTRRLHYLEEADALRALGEVHHIPWEELAHTLASAPCTLQQHAQLVTLDDATKALLLEEGVPLPIALLLLRLQTEAHRCAVAECIAAQRLCIRDAALLVAAELRRENKLGIKREKHSEYNEVNNGKCEGEAGAPEETAEPRCSGQRVKQVIRDVRLYLNAIRELAGQMRSAGFAATLDEHCVAGQQELVIRVPVRQRRTERFRALYGQADAK